MKRKPLCQSISGVDPRVKKQDRIRQLASAFLAYYEINSETDDDEYYLIDHTSYVYLVDKNGALLGYYLESNPSEELAALILKDLPK